MFRPGQPDDDISYHSPVIYDPAADCPRFKAFMEEIFTGDTELIDSCSERLATV